MKGLLFSSLLFIGIALFGAQFHMNDHTILRNPSSYAPAQGYDAWWKADAITGATDGAPLTNWVDSGVGGLNLYQTDATIAPIYKTNQLNGLPTVQFSLNGTNNQYYIMPVLTNFTWGELFVVGRTKDDPGTNVTYTGPFVHAGAFAFSYLGASAYVDGTTWSVFGTATAKIIGYTKMTMAAWRVYGAASQTNSYRAWIDGTQVYSDVTNTVSMSTLSTNRWVGMTRETSGTTRYLQGEIAEILIYNEVLSTADRLATYQYLTNKWGLYPSTPNTNNLIGWWNTSGLTNTTDGSGVANWFDSFSTNHLTQTTTNLQPFFKTNIFGSYPGVAFGPTASANQAHLIVPSMFGGLTAGEVAIVLKRFADPPTTSTNAGFWAMSSDAFNGGHYVWTDGNSYDTWGATGQSFGTVISPSLTNINYYNVVSTASIWSHGAYGKTLRTRVPNTVGFASSPYYLGRSKGSPNSYYDGYFVEMLIWSAAQTPAQRSQSYRYLEQKYGITF